MIAQGTSGGGGTARQRRATPSLSICNNSTGAVPGDCDKEEPVLPGPRKKQAESLYRNIEWLAGEFGLESLGFLTLTVGDHALGQFVGITDRKEAEKRFNSLLTHVLKARYRCGVVTVERHKSGCLHYHLVVVLAGSPSTTAVCRDIRTGFDWDKFLVFRRGGRRFRASQVGACDVLAVEWAFLRRVLPAYGFGRSELTPSRGNAVGLGRYMGKYLSKDWAARLPSDKGGRSVRYFGHWSKSSWWRRDALTGRLYKRRSSRPFGCQFGWFTPRARAWREMLRQVSIVALARDSIAINADNVAQLFGQRWAFRFSRGVRGVVFVQEEGRGDCQRGLADHNFDVAVTFAKSPRAVKPVALAGLNRFFAIGHDRSEVENERERVLYRAAWAAVDDRALHRAELSALADKWESEPF